MHYHHIRTLAGQTKFRISSPNTIKKHIRIYHLTLYILRARNNLQSLHLQVRVPLLPLYRETRATKLPPGLPGNFVCFPLHWTVWCKQGLGLTNVDTSTLSECVKQRLYQSWVTFILASTLLATSHQGTFSVSPMHPPHWLYVQSRVCKPCAHDHKIPLYTCVRPIYTWTKTTVFSC